MSSKEVNIFYKSFWNSVFLLQNVLNKKVTLKKILRSYKGKDVHFIKKILSDILKNYYYLEYFVKKYVKIHKISINLKLYYALIIVTLFLIKYNEIIINLDNIFNENEIEVVRNYIRFLINNKSNIIKEIDSIEDYTEKLHLKYSINKWFLNKILNILGMEETVEFLEKINSKYTFYIRIMDVNREDEITKLLKEEYNIILEKTDIPYVYKIVKGSFKAELAFRYKIPISTSDYSSMFSIFILNKIIERIFNYKKTIKILDGFAAPGSKFSYLLQLNNKIKLKAIDVDKNRFERMKKLVDFFNIRNVTIENKNFLDINEDFDIILMDVPCTNSGTIWQNPELKIKINETDLVKAKDNQIKFIKHAVNLKPKLIYYATCSIFIEENEENIELFIKNNYIPYRLNIENNIPFGIKRFIFWDKVYRFWPHKTNTQGFFFAILFKRKFFEKIKDKLLNNIKR